MTMENIHQAVKIYFQYTFIDLKYILIWKFIFVKANPY